MQHNNNNALTTEEINLSEEAWAAIFSVPRSASFEEGLNRMANDFQSMDSFNPYVNIPQTDASSFQSEKMFNANPVHQHLESENNSNPTQLFSNINNNITFFQPDLDTATPKTKEEPHKYILVGNKGPWPFTYDEKQNAYFLNTDFKKHKSNEDLAVFYMRIHNLTDSKVKDFIQYSNNINNNNNNNNSSNLTLTISAENYFQQISIIEQNIIKPDNSLAPINNEPPSKEISQLYSLDIAKEQMLKHDNYPDVMVLGLTGGYMFELKNDKYTYKFQDPTTIKDYLNKFSVKTYNLEIVMDNDNSSIILTLENYKKFIRTCIEYPNMADIIPFKLQFAFKKLKKFESPSTATPTLNNTHPSFSQASPSHKRVFISEKEMTSIYNTLRYQDQRKRIKKVESENLNKKNRNKNNKQ